MARSSRKPKVKKPAQGQTAFEFTERCEDLPLFSGTPIPVKESPFISRAQARQTSLFGQPTLEEMQAADAQRKQKESQQ